MGRKKIDKNSIEYLANNLFHKDKFLGFQFTVGRTPKEEIDKKPYYLSCSLNKDGRSVVIDCSESVLEDKIIEAIFPNLDAKNASIIQIEVDTEYIKYLVKTFEKLELEYESAKFAGEWFWFRVKCAPDEVTKYVQLLKENITPPKNKTT